MSRSSSALTPVELEVMRVIWDCEGEATVRAVHKQLSCIRSIALTSVLTMMKILNQKGYLRRERTERGSVYHPTLSRREGLQKMLAVFINDVFDGSVEALLDHLPDLSTTTKVNRRRAV